MDYEELIKKVINRQTTANCDGTYLTVKALDYLSNCPFMDAVAEVLGIQVMGLYNNLRYYLMQEEFEILLEDLKERRKFQLNWLKKELLELPKNFERYYL